MNATVVTSWGVAGWELYGQHFLQTFCQYWDPAYRLVIYTENQRVWHGRPLVRNLLADTDCRKFLARHADDPSAAGRAPMPTWRQKDRQEGYSFRHDAYKFCRKVFALAHAARRIEEGLLIWVDGDVVTHAPISEHLMPTLLGSKYDMAFLGRTGTHSECGFMIFRLPECLGFLETFAALYASDRVFDLPETHDSFVFDWLRRGHFKHLRQHDLTPGGWGSVWDRSLLATYMDHRKGDRKHAALRPA